jgi:hypothetical protein
MKNVNKQPVLKLSLCVLLLGLINVSANNSAFAVQNLKQDFLRVVVDRDYLAHFKMAKYLQSILWVQHPGRALTQPRYKDAKWGDIAMTPQEEKYSGWIVLANPPDSNSDTRITSFHEAIHAYHFYVHSNADNDDYGAPENITNNYGSLIMSLRILDKRMEEIQEKIKTGKDYKSDLQSLRKSIKMREEEYKEFANSKFNEVLNNIGGRADWDGYSRAINQAIADAEAGAPELLTSPNKQLGAFRRQLAVLTARLNKIEDTIPDFEREKAEYKAKWDEEELTMKLHIAAALRAVKEAREADSIISNLVSAGLFISENLGEFKQIMGSVTEKTADLNLINIAYAPAAMKASKAADTVCDYASRAASQPPPTADKITGWISESDGLITKVSVSVPKATKEVTERIELLDSDISSLRTKLKYFEDFLPRRDTIFADIKRSEQIKSNLDDAEKDIKRAEEIYANYLKTFMSERKRVYGGRRKEIEDLWRETGVLVQAVRGRDRQLEADVAKLWARIKAAANKVWIDPPSAPPVTPYQLAPDVDALLTKFKSADSARPKFEEGFRLVDSAVADGRRAISDAEAAVAAGASATKKAAADLKRARQCYASLIIGEFQEEVAHKEDEDDDGGPLAALKKRLAVVEVDIPKLKRIKTKYDEELRSAEKSIKVHINRAQQLMDEADAIAAEMYSRFQEGITSADPAEINRLTQDLSARTQEFEAIYVRFANAAGNATKTRDEICGYKEKTSASPPPSADEVRAWKDKSTKLIEQTAIALKIAADEVSGKRKAVNALVDKLRPLLDGYKKTITLFLAVEKTVEKLRKDMDEAEKELKDAVEVRKQESISLSVGLYNKYRNVMIDEVLAIISELNILGETADSKLKLEVAKLKGRAKYVEQQLTGMPELRPSEKLPEVPQFSTPKHVSELDYLYRKNKLKSETVEIANQTIANGRKAISDAVSAHELGRFATEKAPQILEEARQCYASLEKAEEAILKIDEKLYADAKAAIQTCKFEDARKLIDQMPASPKRIELEQEYQASVGLENRLKALVEKASGEYKIRHYGDALSTLDKALLEATCERHLKSINKKIAMVNQAVLKLYNNAKAALQSCDFERARKLIDLMPPGPKKAGLEQEYQASVGLENRLKALVEKASGEYKIRHYGDALSTLNTALGDAKCEKHLKSINKKIAMVRSKMGPAPEERVATPGGVGAFGSAGEITDPELIKELTGATEITPHSGPGPGDRRESSQPTDDEETITVNWEILKVDKHCSFSALWGKDLRESDTYWALFEIPRSKDEIFFGPGLEANRYFEYLIVNHGKEDRDKRLRRNDPPPHESYAKYYRKDNNKQIRVVAVAETRAEIERLRDQQWSTRDREITKENDKRWYNLTKRIEQRMVSEGKPIGPDRDYTKGPGFDSGMTHINTDVLGRIVQDIQTGKLRINLLKNGVIVDTVKLE